MARPECVYCGTTECLRQYHDGGGYIEPDYICGDCFRTQDDGPCFDDLPEVEPPQPIPAPDHKRRIADYAANVQRQRDLVRKTRGE